MIKFPKLHILLTFAAIAVAGVGNGAAEDIVIHKSDGSGSIVSKLSSSTRITFKGSSMVLKSAGAEALEIPLGKIENMTFDIATSSIEEIESPLTEELTFVVDHKKVKVISASGADVDMHIFDSSGKLMDAVFSVGTAEYDFSDKAGGIYIIRSAGKYIKYLNK